MKWIWLLLVLAIIGELMDTMEFADAAKKKKKKITRKKKKSKAKKKPNRKGTTSPKPYSALDASLLFYSPMPPFRPPGGDGPSIEPLMNTEGTFAGDPNSAIRFNLPPAEPVFVDIQSAALVMGKKELQKNGWFNMVRQRRAIDENAIVLEYLGLLDKGQSNEFGLERSKRNIHMLKIAGSKGAGDNMDSNAAEGKVNITAEIRRQKRSNDVEAKRKEVQAKRQENRDKIKGKTDEIKNRPERNPEKLIEQSDKVQKGKLQNNRDEIKGTLSKRDINMPESLKDKIKKQQQENSERPQGGKKNNMSRSKRGTHKDEKMNNKIKNHERELQAKREEMNDKRTRPKRNINPDEINDKVKNTKQKMDGKRDEVKDKLGRAKRDTKRDEIKNNMKNKQQEALDKIHAKKAEIERQKRDIKSHVEQVKEKIETRRQKKRKEKREKQEAKRNERQQKLNAMTNQSQTADQSHLLPEGPTFQTQVMPTEATTIRMKRSIDAELPRLQALTTPDNDDDSSYSEEYSGEDWSSDESCSGPDCFDDPDEDMIPATGNTGEIRLKRETINDQFHSPEHYPSQYKSTMPPKEGFETVPRSKRQSELPGTVPGGPEINAASIECIGDDCSSEECVGDDCTYEDSDSDESEEVLKVVAKRQVEDNGPLDLLFRQRREIGAPRKTGFGSVKQTGFADCGYEDGDYGDEYGSSDYEEEQRRRRRRKKNGRNRNNRRNRKNRKNNRRNKPVPRRQSSTSFNESHRSPFNISAATPLPAFNRMTEPSNNMIHALGRRQIQQRERIVTTTMPSRISYTRAPTNLERPKRDVQPVLYFSPPIHLNDTGNGTGLNDYHQISLGIPHNQEPNIMLTLIPHQLQTSAIAAAKVKREAQESLDIKSDRQPTRPNSNKEGGRGKRPPTERSGIWNKNTETSKREAPNNPPNKQPREENKQGRRPPIDRPESQVEKFDRQRRDIDIMTIMHRPMPKLSDDELAKLLHATNLSKDILPISSFELTPIQMTPLLANLETIPIIVKREATNRPEKQPRGPRPNRNSTQGRGPPSAKPELPNKRPDVNRPKRDLPQPLPAALSPEQIQESSKMTFNIPEGNAEGSVNGMLHTDMKYKTDVRERGQRNQLQREKPSRPQLIGNRNDQDRRKRSADLNSVTNIEGSYTRTLFLPLDDVQSDDGKQIPIEKLEAISIGTFDIKKTMGIVKREAYESRQPNQQRRPDGNRRNDKIDQELGRGDRPNRPNRKGPSERPQGPNDNERQKRSPSLNPGQGPENVQYRLSNSLTHPLSIRHENNDKTTLSAPAFVSL